MAVVKLEANLHERRLVVDAQNVQDVGRFKCLAAYKAILEAIFVPAVPLCGDIRRCGSAGAERED